MAAALLGYRCTLKFTPPASQGKPRASWSLTVGFPGLVSQEVANERAKIVRQCFDALQQQMLVGPGLDPGQSNIAFGTDVSPVWADVDAPPFTNKP